MTVHTSQCSLDVFIEEFLVAEVDFYSFSVIHETLSFDYCAWAFTITFGLVFTHVGDLSALKSCISLFWIVGIEFVENRCQIFCEEYDQFTTSC
jgi:hypothetical protein